MPDGPNVAGMVADPDFQALAPIDKRAALVKVTGDQSFAALNDGETMQFVSRFNTKPTEATANAPQASALLQSQGLGNLAAAQGGDVQASQQQIAQGQQLMQGAAGANEKGATAKQRAARQGMLRNAAISGVNALPGIGMVAGGALASPADVVSGPVGTVGGAALGGAAGEALKNPLLRMLGQQQPEPFSAQNMKNLGEAAKQGAMTEMGAQILGVGINAASPVVSKGIQKLMGESPERIAQLQSLFPKEQALEGAVNQAEEGSRAAFKKAYADMGIDSAPVNVAATKNLANNAATELEKFTGVPRPLAKVQGIPDPSQALLTSDDPATILEQLKSWQQVPFRDAQLMRSNIEQYISRARPPAQVYNALKQVSGALSDSLEAAADREGVLDQYQAANKMFKDHAADFWNKGAPLRDYLPNTKGGKVIAGQEGATLNRLTQTANQSRALDALERRGVSTDQIRQIISQGAKSVKTDIADAVTLKNVGRTPLDIKARTPVRQKWATRGLEAAGVGGGGLLADYLTRKFAEYSSRKSPGQ